MTNNRNKNNKNNKNNKDKRQLQVWTVASKYGSLKS